MKLIYVFLLLIFIHFFIPSAAARAGNHYLDGCPSLSEPVAELLTQKALKYNVPPALVKAIALVESGGRHYRWDGSVVVGGSGEIGIMQVLPIPALFSSEEEVEKLHELEFNIETGIKLLIEKKMSSGTVLPVFVEPYDRQLLAMDDDILESWYFAIWAYNGWYPDNPKNHPIINAGSTYQDKVMRCLASLGYHMAVPPRELFSMQMPAPGEAFPLPGRTPGGLTPLQAGTRAVVNVDRLNVRKKPSTVFGTGRDNVAIVGRLRQGEEVLLLRGPFTANRGRWYQVAAVSVGKPGGEPMGWVAWQYSQKELRFTDYLTIIPGDSEPFQGIELPAVPNIDPWKPNWTIIFNQPPNPLTVTNDNIYIKDQAGNVFGTDVVPEMVTNGVLLYPRALPYHPGEKYYIYIEQGVRSSNGGQTLRQAVRMPFTVRQ